MTTPDLERRLAELAQQLRDRIKRRNKGNFQITVDDTLVEQIHQAELALNEAALALSSARAAQPNEWRKRCLENAQACLDEWWDDTEKDARSGEPIPKSDISQLLYDCVESMPSPEMDQEIVAARAAGREEAAQVADVRARKLDWPECGIAEEIAAAIRALGDSPQPEKSK